MSFGIIRGSLGLSGYRRVSVQAWRTPNGVFRNYRRFDRYDVFAIWETGPGVYAYLQGGTDSRPALEMALAAIRSWRVR